MILLVDIGNTRAKFCLCDSGKLTNIHSIDNDLLSETYLQREFAFVTRVIVASVNKPRLLEILSVWAKANNKKLEEIKTQANAFGIDCAYREYQHLGIDRWVAIIGANKLYPNRNLLIVDAGTALTIDALTADGQHLGGWISPGVQTAINAVLANTTKVFGERADCNELSFGTATAEGLQQGCWASVLGSVTLAVNVFEKTHDNIKLVFTGGDGKVLSDIVSVDSVYHSDLLFCGMSRYVAR